MIAISVGGIAAINKPRNHTTRKEQAEQAIEAQEEEIKQFNIYGKSQEIFAVSQLRFPPPVVLCATDEE